jgi:hypothetical protein
MSPDERPDDLAALATLQPVDPPRELSDRVRRQAHGELEAASNGDWLAMATRAWTRVGLPAALTMTVVGYLAWAVSATGSLYP